MWVIILIPWNFCPLLIIMTSSMNKHENKMIIFACRIYHLLSQWQALSLALSSSFNSLRDSMRMMLLIPLYEWGNWASETLRNFSNYLRAYDRPILILNLCSWSLRALPNYLQSVIPWIKKHVSSKKLLYQKWKWSPEPNLWYLTDRCKHSVSGIFSLEESIENFQLQYLVSTHSNTFPIIYDWQVQKGKEPY